MSRVLCIADQQEPFSHDDYLAFLLAVRKKYKTDRAVHIGDEFDLAALSDYDHDPDGYSAGHELQKGIDRMKFYFNAFSELDLCNSNHVERLSKKAFKAGIPVICIRDFKEVIGAPDGWHWKDEHEIDGVLYKHGVGYSGSLGAINAAKDAMQSCVIGHLHADAGILFYNNGKKTVFGMNVGCGINPDSSAFKYGKHCRKKPVLSCGVILDGQPLLILMNTINGRWDKKVT